MKFFSENSILAKKIFVVLFKITLPAPHLNFMSDGTPAAQTADYLRDYLDPSDFRRSIIRMMKYFSFFCFLTHIIRNRNCNFTSDLILLIRLKITASTSINIIDKVKVEIDDHFVIDCSCHKEAKLVVFLPISLIAYNDKLEIGHFRKIPPFFIRPHFNNEYFNDAQKKEKEEIEKRYFGTVDLVEYDDKIFGLRTIKQDLLLSTTDFPNVHASLVLPKHLFIAVIHSSFATDEYLYIISEYPSYGDFNFLMQFMTEDDTSSEVFKLNIAQISTAIDFCHSHSLLSGGFSKENILLDENGNSIITQFDNISQPLLPTFSESEYSSLSSSKKNNIYDWQYLGHVIQMAVSSVPSLLFQNIQSYKSSGNNEERKSQNSSSMSFVNFIFTQRAAFSKRKARFDSIKIHHFFKGIKWIPNPERRCIIPTAKEPNPSLMNSLSSSIIK